MKPLDPRGPDSAGTPDPVALLFDGHYDRLCRLAFLLVGDAPGAEDIVQEAFLRTFSGWRRIREPDRAHAYLARAVVNLCNSRFRRRAVEDRCNRTVYRDDERVAPDADRRDTAMVVLDAVRCLPDRQRTTVMLRYYADLSEADIARAMGCAPGTVKSQLAKARLTLSRTLGDEDVLLEGRSR